MDFNFSVVVQNSINVDQKHRHDIPRHQVKQVEIIHKFTSFCFSGFSVHSSWF